MISIFWEKITDLAILCSFQTKGRTPKPKGRHQGMHFGTASSKKFQNWFFGTSYPFEILESGSHLPEFLSGRAGQPKFLKMAGKGAKFQFIEFQMLPMTTKSLKSKNEAHISGKWIKFIR